jgi:hypothetical protein
MEYGVKKRGKEFLILGYSIIPLFHHSIIPIFQSSILHVFQVFRFLRRHYTGKGRGRQEKTLPHIPAVYPEKSPKKVLTGFLSYDLRRN